LSDPLTGTVTFLFPAFLSLRTTNSIQRLEAIIRDRTVEPLGDLGWADATVVAQVRSVKVWAELRGA
jgi:hypothetical protein